MDYPKFSEFAKEDRHLEGPKKRIDEVLNLEILILGYKIGKSRYKEKNYAALSPQTIISVIASYMGWIGFCNGYNLQKKFIINNDTIQSILSRARRDLSDR